MDTNSRITYSFNSWLPEQKWENNSIINDIEHFFRLNGDTGEIFLKFTPDREEQSSYKFQMSATDQGIPPLSSKTNVILEIEDMNDNSPVFSKSSYRFLIQVDRSGIIPEGELKVNLIRIFIYEITLTCYFSNYALFFYFPTIYFIIL